MEKTELSARIAQLASGAVSTVRVAAEELGTAMQLLMTGGRRCYSSRGTDGSWTLSLNRTAY